MNKQNLKALVKLTGCAAMLVGILWFLAYRLMHIDMTSLRAIVENPAPIILALAGWFLASLGEDK
jgi:fucose permease